MLEIYVPEQEKYDEVSEVFVSIKDTTLELEHSLVSLRKWESKNHKIFLGNEEKTIDELIDYIVCMTINKEKVDQNVYSFLTESDLIKIVDYIKDPMTATWFGNNNRLGASNRNGELISAEVIYYWMIAFQVPVEFEKWHLNQLLTLLKVVNIKSGGEKKMSRKEAAAQRAELNRIRRARYRTKG